MNPQDANYLEQQARALGACLRHAAEQDSDLELLALQRERLKRTVSQLSRAPGDSQRIQHGRFWALATVAAAGVLLFVAVGLWRTQQLTPLAFDVVGPGRVSETYVVSPPESATLLRFSDGSTVEAHPNTRLRVPEVHADGAMLMLDSGRATVNVVHRRPTTHWTVVAGSYAIAVVGTRFDVEWLPNLDKLKIDMAEGQIEVGGDKITSPVAVRASQHFEADSEAEWAVTPIGAPAKPLDVSTARSTTVHDPDRELAASGLSSGSAELANSAIAPRAESLAFATPVAPARAFAHSAPAASGGHADPAVPGPPSSPPASAIQSPLETSNLSWSKLVARGDSRRVIAEAEAMGQKACFSQCSVADLRALADAARYSGRLDMAEAALRAVRERFPAQAPVAAYLLATVDEARGRNASALRWYEAYLAEAPGGGFLSEALAGRLRMLVATNGYTSARSAAREYLELFPNGVGAKTATQVLQSR